MHGPIRPRPNGSNKTCINLHAAPETPKCRTKMNLNYLFVLQCGLFSFVQSSPHDARSSVSAGTASSSSGASRKQRLFRRNVPPRLSTIEYTLMTLNSPDCESSLADNFPVRVQYRELSPDRTPGKWMNLNSTIVPG